MKKIFIHSGLHKTGTTALQTVLFNNREPLLRQGFYYPHHGIPRHFYGHHNIAWQFSRDRRFRAEFGDVRALLKELDDTDHSSIVLSSEDFESSLLHAYRLKKISDYFLSKQIKVCFVIYFRNQIDYLNSVYFELLKVGFGDEFSQFVKRVITTHQFDFKEWQFIFDYSAIPQTLNALKDVEIIYRDYDALVENNTVADFCEVVGIDYRQLEVPQNIRKIYERPPLSTLLKLFVSNRVRVPPDSISAIVEELCAGLNHALMPSMHVRKALAELSDRNLFYKKKDSPNPQDADADGLNIEKVFSFETCDLILTLKKLSNHYDRKQQFIQEWGQWVKVESSRTPSLK